MAIHNVHESRETMSPEKIFIVFPPDLATINGMKVAEKHRWQHAQTILPAEKRLYEEIYRVDDDTVVRVIDDHFVQVIFALIRGESRQEIATVIRDALEALDVDALWTWLDAGEERRRTHAVRALGAICPDTADVRWVEAFRKAAHDPSPKVRIGLADALARAAWPELWPVLDELEQNEQDEGLRRELKSVREAYAAHLPRK